jgi:hypothetical protein
MHIREHAPPRQYKTGRDGPNLFDDLMGKQRREQPQDSIFGDNPFVDGFLEWMGSREGPQCIEVHDVLWDLLEDVQLDAKQRQLIWPDAKCTARKQRLDLDQSVQRIQKLHSDFARDEIEEFLLDWIDMDYDQTTPRRNSTNSTSLQRSGLPTISGRPRCQKNGR